MVDIPPLIDHHCHGIVTGDLGRPAIEALMSEAHRPAIPGVTQFDKPLGLAVRRHCAPVLGLDPLADPEAYVEARAALGGEEASRRLLRAAGVAELLIDTGHRADDILDVPGMAALAACPAREVVRIEAVMEDAARAVMAQAEGPSARRGQRLLDEFDARLAERARDAVGLKSIVAYRTTFAIDQTPPSPSEAAAAGEAWLDAMAARGWRRLDDATLVRHALFRALDLCTERRLPLQLHVGVGDRDVDMPRCDPTVFAPFVGAAEERGVPVTLLHCWPFLREAGWMAEVYSNVHLDVGFTLNFTGPAAARVLAEAMEMAPFFKQLYSSDAFGLAELHHLGAVQFRRALGAVLDGWVSQGDCTPRDADRIAAMIARGNARRIYDGVLG